MRDVYGMADWNKVLSAKRGITRPLLHAQRLEIDHPVTGETLVFEAPVAKDMMEVINAILPAGGKLSSVASSTSKVTATKPCCSLTNVMLH
jgi:hypothetical protein